MLQRTDMAVSAYEARWYNVAPPEARCLLFVMLRSTRPLCLTAGKFGTFSMEMFSIVSSPRPLYCFKSKDAKDLFNYRS
ncbi:uncharacterized protein LOC143212910 [Lasioglossum baleicum]|uniref:uncharacterized protein LOC143212910 n=1 Tax=Lasioglossum baleicum TaxID=434251 RepID=UPI003FCEB977